MNLDATDLTLDCLLYNPKTHLISCDLPPIITLNWSARDPHLSPCTCLLLPSKNRNIDSNSLGIISLFALIDPKMAVFIKAKRVSGPLDDRAKARLTGYASSGSEHEADDSCLSSLVHAFFDLDDANGSEEITTTDDDSDRSSTAYALEAIHDMLYPSEKCDPFRQRLQSDVAAAAATLTGKKLSGSGYRRVVMSRLRELGHNAGICKAKWESSGGLTGGNYEYIDIVQDENSEERYIVDLNFAAQFEIARATADYEKLVASLPTVMVSSAEDVRRVVRIIAETMKRSLKRTDLSVPPWRKRRYMLAKWFGSYRRTMNPLPSSAGTAVPAGRGDIQCRAVGFEPMTLQTVSGTR